MNVIILHGTLGNPEGNWFPWLAKELERLGHTTIRPQLSTPEGQNPENWIKEISEVVHSLGGLSEKIIIVAHSMSPLAVCQYLETVSAPIRACFFVAGFAQELPNLPEPYPSLNNPFIKKPIDWEKVKKNSNFFTCFMSNNDTYVPIEIANDFAKRLEAKKILISEGGHFTAKNGFTEFPLLLEVIGKLLHE